MIHIGSQPLDVSAAYAAMLSEAAGAVVIFSGNVRCENDGKAVQQLYYEAYDEMARKVLEAICQEATQRWGLVRMDIHQRVGWIPLGQPAVLVLAASPHRTEAFLAARYGIDELKKRAPIWKKEIYRDGSECWVACHHGDEGDAPPHGPSHHHSSSGGGSCG